MRYSYSVWLDNVAHVNYSLFLTLLINLLNSEQQGIVLANSFSLFFKTCFSFGWFYCLLLDRVNLVMHANY